MDEQEESFKHRRESDPDGQFVQTARRFDAGLSMLWRWGLVAVVLIGFGMTIRTVISESSDATRAASAKADSLVKSFDDFKTEIRGRLDNIGADARAANNDVRDLKAEIKQLRDQQKERSDQQSLLDSRIIVLEKSYSRLEGRLSK